MGNNFIAIHHGSLVVADLQRSLLFYRNVLGMPINHDRPAMSFDGAWLNIGSDQQIHLLQLPNPDPTENRPKHGGRDRHLALHVISVNDIKRRLQQHDIDFTLSKSGRAALFCRDPDGNALEFIQIEGEGV